MSGHLIARETIAPLSPGIKSQCVIKILFVKVRPERIAKIKFRVGKIP
jgi:hypothetical protein